MSDEKKFSLDELPDEGSSPSETSKEAPPKLKPKLIDPRVEKLKNLNDSERVRVMSDKWHFDQPETSWNGVLALIGLIVIQKSKILIKLASKQVAAGARPDDVIQQTLFADNPMEFMIAYPIFLALLIPLIFKFRTPSKVYFDINFDGVDGVRTINIPSHSAPDRVFVKWDEILDAKCSKSKNRDILLISTHGGPVELIWDIAPVKKKVINQILKGLVSHKHPLRVLIEKEVS